MKKLISFATVLFLLIQPAIASDSSLYIGNSNSHKFHYSYCRWVKKMSDRNKVYNKSREWFVKHGVCSMQGLHPLNKL
jgi:hypothetical protein